MTQPAGGFIDGHPEMMMGYAAEGPPPELPGATDPLTSEMAEGKLLATADTTSSEQLLAFVVEANTLVGDLTNGAQASGQIYLEAEEVARTTIIGVADLDPFNEVQ